MFEFSSGCKGSFGFPSNPGLRIILGTSSIISCSSATVNYNHGYDFFLTTYRKDQYLNMCKGMKSEKSVQKLYESGNYT